MFDPLLLITAETTEFSLSQVKFRHVERKDLMDLEWEGEYTHIRRLYRDALHSAQLGESVLWVAEHLIVGIIGQMFVQLDSSRSELANGLDCAYIYRFPFKTQFQRRGVGTHMLKIAEEDLISRGYRKITLNVNRDNDEAKRLYQKHGYKIVAAEPGRWSYVDHLGRVQEVCEPAWRKEKLIQYP